MAESNSSTSRRPYHGSCHCGSTKYVVFLNFPLTTSCNAPPIYKCNCSICHKSGFFHVRLKSSPDDFMLLCTLNPETGEPGYYTRRDWETSFYFCKPCGLRCFSFRAMGEVVEVGVEGWENEEGKRGVRVWRPKKEGWKEGEGSYLSFHAMTLEPGQEGFDLKEWTEKNYIWYLDKKHGKGGQRIGEPHEGGCY